MLQGSKDLECLTKSTPLEKNLFKNAGNQIDQGHLKIYRLALAAMVSILSSILKIKIELEGVSLTKNLLLWEL